MNGNPTSIVAIQFSPDEGSIAFGASGTNLMVYMVDSLTGLVILQRNTDLSGGYSLVSGGLLFDTNG
jgi:hypothetical protein